MYQDPLTSHSADSLRQSPQTTQSTFGSLQRQPSSQFDNLNAAFAMSGLYNNEPIPLRFDPNRLGQTMPMPSATWNPGHFPPPFPGVAGQSPSGAFTQHVNPKIRRGRAGLPGTWLDQSSMARAFSMGAPQPISSHSLRDDAQNQDGDEELIPTAIVIKNIPFAVKKEQLVQLMTELNLPLPYAFNYHFDNGVFRGLAFANFTTPEETALVIEALNHYDLHGRKLRVEYKKMLPLQERERIEREKRERRGQLEEQHRPVPTSLLSSHSQPSLSPVPSYMMSASSSPISGPPRSNKIEVDMNDQETLDFYTKLICFKQSPTSEELNFPSDLTPVQRRVVHTLAHNLGLAHDSKGSGSQRHVCVWNSAFQVPNGLSPAASASVSPLQMGSLPHAADPRRSLSRAATIDFSEARNDSGAGPFTALRSHQSAFLNVMDDNSAFGSMSQSLRPAKSFADLRSYSPSPSLSSRYSTIQPNPTPRMSSYDVSSTLHSASLASPVNHLSSTASLGGGPLHRPPVATTNDELLGPLSSLSLSTPAAPGTADARLRSMLSWEQVAQHEQQQSSAAPSPSASAMPIGSNRRPSSPADRMTAAPRQPLASMPDLGNGFMRGSVSTPAPDSSNSQCQSPASNRGLRTGVDALVE